MLFPKCEFEIVTADGSMVAGRINQLELRLNAPEAIPRATALYFKFGASAWCGYSSGKSHSVETRSLLETVFQLKLPQGGLPAGSSKYPFSLDLPPWMPDAYIGGDCGIHVKADVRLDVDWALDPHVTFTPRIVQVAKSEQKSPLFVRTDASFHKDFVIELAFESTTVVSGGVLRGTLALRSGGDKRFEGIILTVNSLATAVFSRATQRTAQLAAYRIPVDALLAGNPVPFSIPIDPAYAVTMRTGLFDVCAQFKMTLDLPWAFDPSFTVPFDILPRGSEVHGDGGAVVVGSKRVAGLAAHVASAVGIPAAAPPQIFAARTGLVAASLIDTPREGRIGVTVRFDFPDLNLGFESHEMGVLDGFRTSTVLPAGLRERYWLDVKRQRRESELNATLERFVTAATAGLRNVDAFCISSHHLTWFVEYGGNEADFVERLARFLLARSLEIHEAAMHLPLPPAAAAYTAAWQRAAEELGLMALTTQARVSTDQAARYVPSVPAILGLRSEVRVTGGETRAFVVNLSTEWKGTEAADAHTVLTFTPENFVFGAGRDASGARQGTIDPSHPLLSRVRELFPEILHASSSELQVACPGLLPDPNAALALTDGLIFWALETRNERQVDAPYR